MGKIRLTSAGAAPLPYRKLKRHAQMESAVAERGINPLRAKRWNKEYDVEILKRPTKEAKHASKVFKRALKQKT